jgi:hypothetical protein
VVDAVFNLMNTGETKTEWVGFPKWVASRLPEYPTFMRFKGSINGSPIEFDEKWDLSGCRPFEERPSAKERERYSAMPLREERQWVASHITFAGHAATTIHVRYEALYYCKGEAFYFMGTGSLWKGNIGKAVFTVYCGAVGGTEDVSIDFEKDPGAVLVPENVQSASSPRVPHTFRFEIVDFKPDREANVRIRVRKMPFMRVFPANRPPEGTPMPFGGPVPLVPLPSHLNTVPVGK